MINYWIPYKIDPLKFFMMTPSSERDLKNIVEGKKSWTESHSLRASVENLNHLAQKATLSSNDNPWLSTFSYGVNFTFDISVNFNSNGSSMNRINPETGEVTPRTKSPRFQLWISFFVFATITTFSSIALVSLIKEGLVARRFFNGTEVSPWWILFAVYHWNDH